MSRRTDCNVARDFEAGLHAVYGKFDSQQTSDNSRYEIYCNDSHFLRPVRILSQCLVTNRHANGLNSEWDSHFFIMQQVSGQTRVGSDDRIGILRPNDMVLLDSFSAYEYLTVRTSESVLMPFHFNFVDSPRNLLASCGQRIDGSAGIGRVLGTTLATLVNFGPSPCPEDQRAMLDAVRLLLGRVLDQGPEDAPRDASDLMARAEQFALRRLSDPALSPDGMADAIGVSRRQLYRLFADRGTTPSTWIWQLRLREAHARMTSQSWAGHSLTRIAFDVGFNDMAHFSRLYRSHFGMNPRESRRVHGQVLQTAGTVDQETLAQAGKTGSRPRP